MDDRTGGRMDLCGRGLYEVGMTHTHHNEFEARCDINIYGVTFLFLFLYHIKACITIS